MVSQPSLWRIELLHPLLVHFPVALLLVGSLVRIGGSALLPKWQSGSLVFAGRLMIGVGVLGSWAAIYSGTEAYYAVVRSLCDPTVADHHSTIAYWAAGLFTGTGVLDWWLASRRGSILSPGVRSLLLNGLWILASGLLIYTAHLGSSLVYQQAAGVYQPSPQCVEFYDPEGSTAN